MSPYVSWTRSPTSTPYCRQCGISLSTNARFRPRGLGAGLTHKEGAMEGLHPRCAGLDVHKDSVVALPES
jgi:hypothetical protein